MSEPRTSIELHEAWQEWSRMQHGIGNLRMYVNRVAMLEAEKIRRQRHWFVPVTRLALLCRRGQRESRIQRLLEEAEDLCRAQSVEIGQISEADIAGYLRERAAYWRHAARERMSDA